jgi:hypothetical protein
MKEKIFKISDEQIKKMYLSGKSLSDIAKVAQDTKGYMALKRKLNLLGVDTSRNMKRYSYKLSKALHKYTLDDTVFETIDTEEKAYWLGFLYADGYNHESKTCISLRLQESDLEILEKFQNFLKTDCPIKSYERTTRTGKYRKYYELCICSSKISSDLTKLGCIQAKTYIIEFPSVSIVPSVLIRHFIRGYFDGDGCISITKRTDRNIRGNSDRVQFTIAGKKSFIEKCQEYICENTNLPKTAINRSKDGFSVSLHYSGINSVIKILNYLYTGSKIYLKRKHDKYMNLVSRQSNL